jgi:hypothetical protein
MTAPARPPSFFNALSGAHTPYPDALREPGFLLDDLAGDVKIWPYWLLDDDSLRRITLTLVEHVTEQRAVIGFAVDGVSGTITATPDPSGYLRIVVEVTGKVFLAAYVERIWEEYELWPPGAVAAFDVESPGRMGKHLSWVSISSAGWPALAAIANSSGWLNLMQLEERGEVARAE